jgi:hypothetical protein
VRTTNPIHIQYTEESVLEEKNVSCNLTQSLLFTNVYEIISRRMRWAAYAARRVRGEVQTGFWWEDLREGHHLEHPGVDWRIIINWIFRTWDGSWTGLIWLRIGTGARALVTIKNILCLRLLGFWISRIQKI